MTSPFCWWSYHFCWWIPLFLPVKRPFSLVFHHDVAGGWKKTAQATSMWPGVLRRDIGGSYGIISSGNTTVVLMNWRWFNSTYPLVMSSYSYWSHGPVEIVDFPIKHGDFPVRYVSLPGRVTYSHGYVCIIKRFLLVYHHECHDKKILAVWNVIMYHHLIIIWSSSDHHLIIIWSSSDHVANWNTWRLFLSLW